MKKLVVNENCIGCGLCISVDEEHFEFDGDLSSAKINENLDSEALKNAINSCPVGAISIVEEDNNETSEQ